MRLGQSSYTYAWAVGVPDYPVDDPLTAQALVERAAALGVGLVQICDNLPLDTRSHAELDALRALADARSVTIEVGTRGSRPDHLLRYLAIAERMGSSILRVVVDSADDRPALDEIVRRIRAVEPAFRSAGVSLAIENHDRFKAADLVGLMQSIDSESVGICLDTVNSFGALEGPEVVVAALAPWTINLHVKDFAISRAGHNMGFTLEGRPAGQGQLDVPWLLDSLARHGRDINAILELWTPPEPTMPATIAKEASWAEQSIAYLRSLISG